VLDVGQAMQDTVGLNQLQHLQGVVSGVESKLATVERAVHDRGSFKDELDKKVDKAYVDMEIQSKAGELYVNADFDKKRLKAYVDAEVQKKADYTYVTTELEKRPVKEEVANAVLSVLQVQR